MAVSVWWVMGSHGDGGWEHVHGSLGAEEGGVHGGHLGGEERVHAEKQSLQRRTLHFLEDQTLSLLCTKPSPQFCRFDERVSYETTQCCHV